MTLALALLGVSPGTTQQIRQTGTFHYNKAVDVEIVERDPELLVYEQRWLLDEISMQIVGVLADGRDYRVSVKPITYEFRNRTFTNIDDLLLACKQSGKCAQFDAPQYQQVILKITVTMKLADPTDAEVGEVADLSGYPNCYSSSLRIPAEDFCTLVFDQRTGRRTS